MHRITSWYNKNRTRIWVAILAIFIIALIWWAFMNMSNQNKRNGQNTYTTIDTNTLNSITMESQQSALSGNGITTNKKGIEAIDNFITYCNFGKIQEAYNLLSKECKEEVYPELSDFQNSYYKHTFGNEKRSVSIQNWIDDIYKVNFVGDALSTGKYEKDSILQDYITIVKDNDGNYKLNIHNYIGRKKIDKTGSYDNIQVKVVKKDIYVDYEIYTFEVTNYSDNSIALGDIENLDCSFLSDKNDLKYAASIGELSQGDIAVGNKQTKVMKIKYANKYSSTREIKKIVFPAIVLDYSSYSEYKYGDWTFGNIEINI